MRFMLVKDLRSDTLMRPLLGGLLLFIALFLLGDVLLKREFIGLDTATVSATLSGDEAAFVEPLSPFSLLEHLHTDIFFIMMTLLTLSAVCARLCRRKRLATVAVHLVMLSALGAVVFLALAYFIGAFFILPWLASFWLWHALALFMAVASLLRLYLPGKA